MYPQARCPEVHRANVFKTCSGHAFAAPGVCRCTGFSDHVFKAPGACHIAGFSACFCNALSLHIFEARDARLFKAHRIGTQVGS